MTDLSRSPEVVNVVAESMYQVPGHILLEYREMKRNLSSAPTVQWCSVHDAQIDRDVNSGVVCDWAYDTKVCVFDTVALVPVEDGE